MPLEYSRRPRLELSRGDDWQGMYLESDGTEP